MTGAARAKEPKWVQVVTQSGREVGIWSLNEHRLIVPNPTGQRKVDALAHFKRILDGEFSEPEFPITQAREEESPPEWERVEEE